MKIFVVGHTIQINVKNTFTKWFDLYNYNDIDELMSDFNESCPGNIIKLVIKEYKLPFDLKVKESFDKEEIEKLIDIKDLINDLENGTDLDSLRHHNEYCENISDNENKIYLFNEQNINEMFSNPWEALHSQHEGNIHFQDSHFKRDEYGNIKSGYLYEFICESDIINHYLN